MSEFLISFNPPLPAAIVAAPPLTFEALDVAAVTAGYSQEHDIIYSIDERAFAYYPASILTVLNDIHLEWMLIRKGSSHDVTLSGYTVLEAVSEHGDFQFHDPRWPPTTVGDKFDSAYLEEKFRSATAAVWSLVLSIQNSQ